MFEVLALALLLAVGEFGLAFQLALLFQTPWLFQFQDGSFSGAHDVLFTDTPFHVLMVDVLPMVLVRMVGSVVVVVGVVGVVVVGCVVVGWVVGSVVGGVVGSCVGEVVCANKLIEPPTKSIASKVFFIFQ